MNLAQALLYFLREASKNLVRGWSVSLVAVFSIAVSLITGGAFLLLSANVSALLEEWSSRARLVVYLEEGISSEERIAVEQRLASGPAVEAWEEVTPQAAAERLLDSFPSLAPLLQDRSDVPLPASLEVQVDRGAARGEVWDAWWSGLAALPGVEGVDDDRDWIRQMESLVGVARGLGALFGAVLLAAAVLTIASVVRLTVFLHRDEVATLRLVGATEFFIRGPFYAEGLLEGLAGGGLALLALAGLHAWLRDAVPALAGSGALLSQFLPPLEAAALILLGGLAGLLGSLLSVRREDLGGEP